MKKTAEEMKKQISLFVEYKDHDRVILSNANGDAFSSKSEDLIDFLHGIKDSQASELPSDEKSNLPSFLYMNGDNQITVGVYGDSVVTDEWNQFIASHVARIKELENEILKLKRFNSTKKILGRK